MSPFPTPIQPASGHHRQGKLEGNFHIKDEGLAGFKSGDAKENRYSPVAFLLLCSDKFIFNYRKKHPGSHFIFQPGAVINFSSVDHKACKLVNHINC